MADGLTVRTMPCRPQQFFGSNLGSLGVGWWNSLSQREEIGMSARGQRLPAPNHSALLASRRRSAG
jgi:hypothetical protein